MPNFYFILFNLFILLNRGFSQFSSLILQFETNYPSKMNPDNYFESKFINEPKVNLKIGTHRQSIPCYLNINTQTFYISGSNSDLIKTQPKYEEFKSSKYKNISNKITSETFYVYGLPSIDEICLNNEIELIKFYLAKTKFSEKELIYSCVLGLGYEEILYNDDGDMKGIESFITQMKNNNIIADKIFFISYNSENDNGEIIFGTYPHELGNKYCKSCNENDYIEMEHAANEIEVIWSVKGYVYVGEDKIFDYLSPIFFELNQGFIIGSYNYKLKIEKEFFNEKISKNICFKREIYIQTNFYDGYYCIKNVDVTKFENLTIVIDKISYTIEFLYKDLFTENDDYLYFNVLFTQEEDTLKNSFILGKPFFKKYPLVFNVNRKKEKIGFYNNLFMKEENENHIMHNNENNNNNSNNNKLTFILIVIGISILSLLIYIIVKYFKRPRKQKVNELIEFFDYSSVQQKI